MAEEYVQFDLAGAQLVARKTRDMVRQMVNQERRLLLTAIRHHQSGWVPVDIYIAKTGAVAIPGRQDDTPVAGQSSPGSGQVELYRINGQGALEATGRTDTAYNLSAEEVGANKWIQLKRERLSRKLLVDFEEC